MAEEKKSVVLFPSPGLSHLISMVELGKLLLSQSSSLSITILSPIFPFNTDSTSDYIFSVSSAFPSICFQFLPLIPLLRGDTSNYTHMEEIIYENRRHQNSNVREFLSNHSVSAFILDLSCYPAFEVSHSLQIPTFFFLTSSASVLALILHFPIFDKLTTDSFQNPESTPSEISGLFSVPADQMGEATFLRGFFYDEFVDSAKHLPESDGIIVNSFESLEPSAIKILREGIFLPGTQIPPIYPMGPLIGSRGGERNECLSWLDTQPSRSVVYLGFRSWSMLSKKQLKEMAVGLEMSGERFLWVIRCPPIEEQFIPPRPKPDLELLLPSGFVDRTRGRGLVVESWVPQVEILGHEAIGGFVSHCDWNSTLEAICAGVPMVAWPLSVEGRLNKISLVEDIKIAIPMNESRDGFIVSEEIKKRVKQILELDEGNVVRERVSVLSAQAKAATRVGGSSTAVLANFVTSWKLVND